MSENKKDKVLKLLISNIIESEGLEDIICDIIVFGTIVKNIVIIRIDIKGDKISEHRMGKLIQKELERWIPETIFIKVLKVDENCNVIDEE